MKFNKSINTIYRVGKIHVNSEKNFNKNYMKSYEGHKTISKDHYILRHAFNILDYVKNENNEIDPKEYLQEDRREKYKFNIYNFEKFLKPDKSKKLFSIDDELLKILLLRINRKNIEEQLKKREKMKIFQSLSLKGIRKINNFEKTFNTTKSLKSYNNYSAHKSSNSSYINYNTSSSKILKSKNIMSYNNINKTKTLQRYEPPTQFYFNNLNERLKDIFQNINSEEKNILTKYEFIETNFKKMFKYYKDNKKGSKTLNVEKIQRPKYIIKNPGKIKKKKDLENILFKDYELAFNRVKNKIYTSYKFPKLKI